MREGRKAHGARHKEDLTDSQKVKTSRKDAKTAHGAGHKAHGRECISRCYPCGLCGLCEKPDFSQDREDLVQRNRVRMALLHDEGCRSPFSGPIRAWGRQRQGTERFCP